MRKDKKRRRGDDASPSTGPAQADRSTPPGTSEDYDHGKTGEAREYAPGGLVRPDERYSDQQQYGQGDGSSDETPPKDVAKRTRLRPKSDRA